MSKPNNEMTKITIVNEDLVDRMRRVGEKFIGVNVKYLGPYAGTRDLGPDAGVITFTHGDDAYAEFHSWEEVEEYCKLRESED